MLINRKKSDTKLGLQHLLTTHPSLVGNPILFLTPFAFLSFHPSNLMANPILLIHPYPVLPTSPSYPSPLSSSFSTSIYSSSFSSIYSYSSSSSSSVYSYSYSSSSSSPHRILSEARRSIAKSNKRGGYGAARAGGPIQGAAVGLVHYAGPCHEVL